MMVFCCSRYTLIHWANKGKGALDNPADTMSGFFANGKGAANPLNQLGNREGVDRSLFKVCPTPGI